MNHTGRNLLAVALLATAWGARGAAAETRILRAAGYLDVVAGRVVAPATIVVEGGAIAAVNPDSMPAGATEVDLPGLILAPGLIDVHTHLTYEISGDWTTRAVRETEADAALRGVKNARRTLLAGFTTVRELGAFAGGADVALMHAIERGDVIGPRIVPARQSISITGGHCDTTGFAPGILEQGPADGTDAGVYEHGLNAQQLAVRVGLGMTPADAIRSATVNAADLLGVEDRGVIAAGLVADLIAVAGDPLGNVALFEDVRFVMKDGEIFKRP